MNLNQRTESLVAEMCAILGATPNQEESRDVRRVVERAIIDVVLAEQERCAGVARICCSPDRDMAHKIAKEMRQTKDVLIANLSAMR